MKILKKIGIVILILIVVLLVAALFVPRDVSYEKSITIHAPIDTVWQHTNSLAAVDEWSPWNDYDPGMKKEMSGTDGTVGAKSSWESDHKHVGKGSQTITKIEEPVFFGSDLKFYTPYESEAKSYIKLQPEGDQTVVTWGFESEIPYPFNLMQLTMNMEEALGKDFSNGLNKLKDLCEN